MNKTLIATVLLTAGALQAQISSGTYHIVNSFSGKRLEVQNSSTANGARVQQNDSTDNDRQKWDLIANGDGSWRIQNVAAGTVLDVEGASQDNDARIHAWTWHGGSNQRWAIESVGGDDYRVVAQHSHRALKLNCQCTTNGESVHQRTWGAYAHQKWEFERTDSIGPNPCIGPQVFFDTGWQNSSYTKNGHTPQWFFPHWSSQYDVACIDEGSPSNSTHIPAIWSNSCTIGCRKLEFKIKGRDNGDDDSIGFVLGFCDGDQNDPNADYLAVIWNGTAQTAQFPNHCAEVTKPKGLHLVRVRGIPDPAEFLGQTNLSCTPSSSGVELLAEAINLGNSSWPVEVERSVRVEMEPNRLRIWVEGRLEFDRAGDYSEYLQGCFGYFAQGQFADFWGLQVTPLNAVNASWNNYGVGTPGCDGVPSIGMVRRPVLGTVGLVNVGNAGNSTATCALFVSLTPGDLFLPLLGGPLNVGLPLAGVVPLSVPPGGTVFECAVPDDSCVAGVSLFWQAICIDPCGPAGFAMSRGLEIIFGDY